LTEPVTKQSRHDGSTRGTKEWLDALSSGACDQDAFFSGVSDLLQKAPDAGWDLLALVDQYYRRGKITVTAFSAVNTRLQGLVMGKTRSDELSAPLPRMQDEPPPLNGAATTASPPTAPVSSAPATTEPPTPISASPARGIPTLSTFVGAAPAVAPSARATPEQSMAGASASAAAPSIPAAAPSIAAAPPSDAAAPDVAAPPRPASAPDAASTPAATHAAADATRNRPQRSIAAGDVLRGRYRVQGVLGQGGMGTVFAAIDQYRLDRSHGDQLVAIKVLHTEVIKRPRLFAELRREFQHLQSLSHPNIVRVHEFDRDGDLAFFTMEHLSGALLSRVLSAQESSALYRPHALALIRDVGAAVAHAHARGVVHGDLYPGNIFVTDNGEVRVLDFGASHQLHRAPWISEFDSSRQIAVATPKYASCQLLEGEAADARDDVYALACIAYVLLTGHHPFKDNNALKARTLRITPRRPTGLSTRQWTALRAGLHFDREQRPSDMQAWLDRLDLRGAAARLPELPSLLTGRPRPRNSTKWPTVGAVIILIVACGWWATANVDSIERAVASTGERFRSIFAQSQSALHQWWDKDLHYAGHAEPVIEAPPELAPTIDGPPGPRLIRPTQPEVRPAAPEARTAPPEARPTQPEARTAPPEARPTQPEVRTAPPTNETNASRNEVVASSTARTGLAGAPAPRVPAASVGAVAAPTKPASPNTVATQNGSPLRARIELAADNVDVPPTEPMAHVVVHRSRNLRGDVGFFWWTESGTAKPGRDFVPVKSHVEQIENGKNAASLDIPIVKDPARRQSRSFYVVIDQAGDEAAVGPRTLTMVTISEPD
jgi:serine/threonine protein kinase